MNKENKWSILNLESVHISPTNYCNFNCIMCSTSRTKCKKGYLEWNIFKKTIIELKDIQTQKETKFCELHFYLEGEPFLNKNYLNMLDYIDQSLENVKVIISTNGSLLTNKIIDKILTLRKNYYIYLISIDASNYELYTKIKPVSNYWLVEENVKYFLKKKKTENIKNPYVVLQFIVMSVNEDDRPNFYWKWESLMGPYIKASFCLYDENILKENLAHIYWKRYYSKNNPFNKKDDLYTSNYGPEFPSPWIPKICVWLWKKLVIGWDGDIKLCCFFPEFTEVIGNIKEDSLKQVFEEGKMNIFRGYFLNKQVEKIPICNNCDPICWGYDKRLESYLGLR